VGDTVPDPSVRPDAYAAAGALRARRTGLHVRGSEGRGGL